MTNGFLAFTLHVVNKWIWISSSLSIKIPSISQNFTKTSCGIFTMTFASFSFVKVALMRNLLSEFLTNASEEQLLHITNTPLGWAFRLHFLQKCEGSNKFKLSGGNETFSNAVVVWTSLISMSAYDSLITVAAIAVRYLPLELFTLTFWSLQTPFLAIKSMRTFHRISLIWSLYEWSYAIISCFFFIPYLVFVLTVFACFRSIQTITLTVSRMLIFIATSCSEVIWLFSLRFF